MSNGVTSLEEGGRANSWNPKLLQFLITTVVRHYLLVTVSFPCVTTLEVVSVIRPSRGPTVSHNELDSFFHPLPKYPLGVFLPENQWPSPFCGRQILPRFLRRSFHRPLFAANAAASIHIPSMVTNRHKTWCRLRLNIAKHCINISFCLICL